MKRVLSLLLTLVCSITLMAAEDMSIYDLQPGHKYYIFNTWYQRALRPNTDASQPRLMAYTAADDQQFLFEAVEAPTAGYVMLKNVATGKWMCASTSNSYSVVLNNSSGTGDSYQWEVRCGAKGMLINKRNTDTCLGVDVKETSDQIGVWYDKQSTADSTTCFQVFEANGSGLNASRKAWALKELANIVDYTLNELATNDKYPLIPRNRMTSHCEQAQSWIANPDPIDIDRIFTKNEHLRDSLGWMTSYESYVMLTETELQNFGSTFSLALANVELNESYPDDFITMLIRNKKGKGIRYNISENGNYVFVQKDAKMKVYVNDVLKETLPTYYLPAYTAQGTEAEWSIIRKSRLTASMPELLSEDSEVTKCGTPIQDKYGKMVRTVLSLNKTNLTLDSQLDLHITDASAPLTSCKINLAHEKAWLILDNVRPSDAISKYLSQVQIYGQPANKDNNCRVVIYLAGCAILPYTSADKVFTGYYGEQYTGQEVALGVGFHNTLGKNTNQIRSFILKRGYMATIASGTNGSGYSRVYVADHQDIEVPVMPAATYGRVSSIIIKKWSYVSKKGYCSTNGTSSISSDGKKIGATWFYTWGADRSSTDDMEYVPIRQHIWWPSMSSIMNQSATACLSINEPEHGEQHDNCDCKGVVSEWTCCTLTPDFQKTGMRIGSPAPTADSWLTTYINHCNDMAYRCDFVAIHAYWGSNECTDGNAWYNRLKAIYDATKRPIWITEWAYGASWTSESWPSGWNDKLEQNRWRVKDIQKKLEEAPFVERYAYYQWDTQYRNLVDWGDGHITPAGKVYRDMKSDFAYRADKQFTPVWWAPGKKGVSMTAIANEKAGTIAVNVNNPNQDVTDILRIERYNMQSDSWDVYYTENDRSKFDADTLRYTFPIADFDLQNDMLRIYVKRLINNGDVAISTPTIIYSKRCQDYSSRIMNRNCNDNNLNGWTVTNTSTSSGEAYDGSSSNTYFNQWKSTAFTSTMEQTVINLPKGRYTLGALLRAKSDCDVKLEVSRVGADASRDTLSTTTIVPTGNTSADDDAYLNGWKQAFCPSVDVMAGESLKIKLTVVCPAGGWWSADNFSLKWESLEPEETGISNVIDDDDYNQNVDKIFDLSGRPATSSDGILIRGGKKLIKK